MVVNSVYFIQASQTIFAAMYSVCLWDWLTSLPRELRLIWKSRWSVVKVLYLLCRYWTICVMPYILWVYLTNHSESECQKLFRSPIYLAMWNQIWAECVLMIRAYAFFGNKLIVLTGLIGLLCAVAGYQLWVTATQVALLPFDSSVGPCFPTVKYPGTPHVMLFFLIALVYDVISTLLTLWRAGQLRQEVGNTNPLLKTFVTEGLYYFVLISCANLINAVFYWQPNHHISAMLVPFSIVLPDILACRMILSLRDRGIGHASSNTASGFYSHSVRRITVGPGRRTAGGKPALPGSVPDPLSDIIFASAKDAGAVVDVGFSHELTTFHQTQHVVSADSDSVIGHDIKTIPYEVGDAPPNDDARSRAGIRIDIESHRYYEERSDGESDRKGDESFVP